MKLKKLYDDANGVFDTIDELGLTRKIRFKYKIIAILFGLIICISPIIIFITLYLYHQYIYLWGLGIVFFVMLGFYLKDCFYLMMLKNDFEALKPKTIKPAILYFALLYLGLGIIFYLFYVVIARLIL